MGCVVLPFARDSLFHLKLEPLKPSSESEPSLIAQRFIPVGYPRAGVAQTIYVL